MSVSLSTQSQKFQPIRTCFTSRINSFKITEVIRSLTLYTNHAGIAVSRSSDYYRGILLLHFKRNVVYLRSCSGIFLLFISLSLLSSDSVKQLSNNLKKKLF